MQVRPLAYALVGAAQGLAPFTRACALPAQRLAPSQDALRPPVQQPRPENDPVDSDVFLCSTLRQGDPTSFSPLFRLPRLRRTASSGWCRLRRSLGRLAAT